MFLGTHTPKLDEKGRFFLPARFREALAEGLVIAKGQERCLAIYTVAEFTEQARAAETFNKELAALRTNAGNAARSLVGDLLPSLNRLFQTFRQTGEAGEGSLDRLLGIGKQTQSIDGYTARIEALNKQLAENNVQGSYRAKILARITELEGKRSQLRNEGGAQRDLDRINQSFASVKPGVGDVLDSDKPAKAAKKKTSKPKAASKPAKKKGKR